MLYYDGNRVYVSEELYYTIFRIKNRVIFAPCEELKKKQRYMKYAINRVFPLKMSTEKCANLHSNKKWVLKMDIKDFYNSVPYEAIMWVMKEVSEYVYKAEVNTYLRYTTLDLKLPTGAPTSAHIANACFRPLDKRIKTYCNNFDIDYSRYMDDMTFSSNEKFYLNMIEKYVRNILNGTGFEINEKKTKYISDNKQQNILGLVVNNGKARVPKKLKRKVRAMLHSYYLFMHRTSELDIKHRAWDKNKVAELNGYIGYIKKVDNDGYQKLKAYCDTKLKW